jgi:hypothetical protein
MSFVEQPAGVLQESYLCTAYGTDHREEVPGRSGLAFCSSLSTDPLDEESETMKKKNGAVLE